MQSVRVFPSNGLEFESRPRQTQVAKQVVTAPLPNARQQFYVWQVITDDHIYVPLNSKCGTLRNPHSSLSMGAEYGWTFSVLYRKWWRLHMSDKSRVGKPPIKKQFWKSTCDRDRMKSAIFFKAKFRIFWSFFS